MSLYEKLVLLFNNIYIKKGALCFKVGWDSLNKGWRKWAGDLILLCTVVISILKIFDIFYK